MGNSKITELQYRDFSLDFHEKMGKKRIPIVGQMELTFRCNLRCVHCYIPEEQRSENSGQKTKELSYSEVCCILDEIHKEGCLWLSFTGGEPLMRDDFLDIYAYAKRKGFVITILTNGTLITKEIADYLSEAPPFCIDLTLNGINKETYENISQVTGSFKKCMEGINLILDRKLPLKIKTKVTRLNYHELDRIKGYVEGLGIQFKPNTMIYTRLDGLLEPCRFRLSPEEVIMLDNIDEDCEPRSASRPSYGFGTKRKRGEEQIMTEEKIPSPTDKLFRCAAGVYSFHISSYGELIFCTFMRKPSFDLRKGSFKEGFYTLYPEIHSAKYQTDSKCKDCKIFYLCSQCPALAELENGHPEDPIGYFCELAHKQAGMKEQIIAKVARRGD